MEGSSQPVPGFQNASQSPLRCPFSEDPFPCNCCKNFHENSHGYCDAHSLCRFHGKLLSRCHFVPRLNGGVNMVVPVAFEAQVTHGRWFSHWKDCDHWIHWIWCPWVSFSVRSPFCLFFAYAVSIFASFWCVAWAFALPSEAFQWLELVMIFFAQAAADIESRALLALIIISLQLESTGSNSFHRPAYQKSRYPCKHRHIMYILNCMLFH